MSDNDSYSDMYSPGEDVAVFGEDSDYDGEEDPVAGPSSLHPRMLDCVPHRFTYNIHHRSHQNTCIFSVPEATLRNCVYARDAHGNDCAVCRN